MTEEKPITTEEGSPLPTAPTDIPTVTLGAISTALTYLIYESWLAGGHVNELLLFTAALWVLIFGLRAAERKVMK